MSCYEKYCPYSVSMTLYHFKKKRIHYLRAYVEIKSLGSSKNYLGQYPSQVCVQVLSICKKIMRERQIHLQVFTNSFTVGELGAFVCMYVVSVYKQARQLFLFLFSTLAFKAQYIYFSRKLYRLVCRFIQVNQLSIHLKSFSFLEYICHFRFSSIYRIIRYFIEITNHLFL